jgi:uncharacterized protein (DUF2147 family)
MKLISLVLGVAVSATSAFAEPITGTWQTEPDNGNYAHIQMTACGEKICGVIARSFNASGEFTSPATGKTLVFDMVAQGDGTYKGKLWRPSNNKIYMGKMKLRGDKLDLSGCIAGGLLCSGQTWTRIN